MSQAARIIEDEYQPVLLKEKQSILLRRLMERLQEYSCFYRKKLEQAGISFADIKSIDDVKYLPFTEKDELSVFIPLPAPPVNRLLFPIPARTWMIGRK